jgi:hypothetical protein
MNCLPDEEYHISGRCQEGDVFHFNAQFSRYSAIPDIN